MSENLECIACGEQAKEHETDSGHCLSCGGECMSIESIYGKDGLYAETSDESSTNDKPAP
ncbi:hypothetical protein AB6D11_00335 [Vibrio splendidus]